MAPALTALLMLAPGALASPEESSRHLLTRFTYSATVNPVETKRLDVWVPLPSSDELQEVSNVAVKTTGAYEITNEAKYGNRMAHVRFEHASGPTEIVVSFDVDRQTAGSGGTPRLEVPRLLQADRLVPVTGRLAEIGREVVGSRKSVQDKIRAIFEHTVATMQYDYKKESPQLGVGDSAFVCDYKKGNCSDLHSYVISLARSQGIPAFLEYGFPLTGIPVPDKVPATGTISGYHCWTWFFDPSRGWLPLDASDARRWLDSKRPDIKEFLLGHLVLERSAVALSRGRDIVLNPPQKQPPLNNFIYPYAELDGAPVEAKWRLTYELLPGAR